MVENCQNVIGVSHTTEKWKIISGDRKCCARPATLQNDDDHIRDFVNTRLHRPQTCQNQCGRVDCLTKPLVHKNMSNFWNNIFHKLGLHFARVRVLHTFNVWTSELWCGRVTFLNHSSTIRVPKNP